MVTESTHPSLLSRVRDPADGVAWREFEDRYGPLILGYCRRLGLQINDAEDVRQIVLTDLSKALPGFQFDPGRARFRTYLGRVVKNAVWRHLRRHASDARQLDTTILATTTGKDENETDQAWEKEWILHHYRLAMQSLRTTCDRKSLDVFDGLVAGKSPAQLAADFQTTPEAVRKIKQRIRDRLQAIVASQIHDEENPDGRQ